LQQSQIALVALREPLDELAPPFSGTQSRVPSRVWLAERHSQELGARPPDAERSLLPQELEPQPRAVPQPETQQVLPEEQRQLKARLPLALPLLEERSARGVQPAWA
jgi:hypothetical protein